MQEKSKIISGNENLSPVVTPELIGTFVDGVSDRAGIGRRDQKSVAGRLLEEVVELALAAGVAPGKIYPTNRKAPAFRPGMQG